MQKDFPSPPAFGGSVSTEDSANHQASPFSNAPQTPLAGPAVVR